MINLNKTNLKKKNVFFFQLTKQNKYHPSYNLAEIKTKFFAICKPIKQVFFMIYNKYYYYYYYEGLIYNLQTTVVLQNKKKIK